jgi:hypothetical protein
MAYNKSTFNRAVKNKGKNWDKKDIEEVKNYYVWGNFKNKFVLSFLTAKAKGKPNGFA